MSPEYFYRPPNVQGEDKDAPLPPGGLLTIGYGTGGVETWSHYVRNDDIHQKGKVTQDAQEVDVSIFKLILTTKPRDLSSFVQGSPFTGEPRAVRRDDLAHIDEWDTESITVKVRRSQK
jgi:hypothetical protein